ncbi:MAG: 4Fe-4S binding protein [Anaerolineae bacterium]
MEIACALNTLVFDADLCVGCGMCNLVCPHGVFSPAEPIRSGSRQLQARLLHPEDCMECGACALNCLTGAIKVDSGVGCAGAMIYAALTGKEVSCGGSGCCGTATTPGASECCSTSVPETAGCCSSSQPATSECCSNAEPQKGSCCSQAEHPTGSSAVGTGKKTAQKSTC